MWLYEKVISFSAEISSPFVESWNYFLKIHKHNLVAKEIFQGDFNVSLGTTLTIEMPHLALLAFPWKSETIW